MNKFLFIFGALLIMAFISCDKNEPEDNNEYYVKYTISATQVSQIDDITYADVEKMVTVDNTKNFLTKWEITIGPVKKGFKAYINNGKNSKLSTAKIEISKNGKPFVMKASGTISATYVIDF